MSKIDNKAFDHAWDAFQEAAREGKHSINVLMASIEAYEAAKTGQPVSGKGAPWPRPQDEDDSPAKTEQPVMSYAAILERLAQEYHRRIGTGNASLPAWDSDREDNRQWCRNKVIEEWLPVLDAAGVKYGA